MLSSLILSEVCCFLKCNQLQKKVGYYLVTSWDPNKALWSTVSRHPALDACSWAIAKRPLPLTGSEDAFCGPLGSEATARPWCAATAVSRPTRLQWPAFFRDAVCKYRFLWAVHLPVCHFEYEAGNEWGLCEMHVQLHTSTSTSYRYLEKLA